jgi:hypothetical protein
MPTGADVVGGARSPGGFIVGTALGVLRGRTVGGRSNTAAEDAAATAAGYHQANPNPARGARGGMYWYDASGNLIGNDQDVRRVVYASTPPIQAGSIYDSPGTPPGPTYANPTPRPIPPSSSPGSVPFEMPYRPPPPQRPYYGPGSPTDTRGSYTPPREPIFRGPTINAPPAGVGMIDIVLAMILGQGIPQAVEKAKQYNQVLSTAIDVLTRPRSYLDIRRGPRSRGRRLRKRQLSPWGMPQTSQPVTNTAPRSRTTPTTSNAPRSAPIPQSVPEISVTSTPILITPPTLQRSSWTLPRVSTIAQYLPLLSLFPSGGRSPKTASFAPPLTPSKPPSVDLPPTYPTSPIQEAYFSQPSSQCTCPDGSRGKSRGKKKKRTVCYSGTYTERATGLSKLKKRKVPCK